MLPDTPVVLLESVWVRVAVEAVAGSGELVEFGVVEIPAGFTVFKAQWRLLPEE